MGETKILLVEDEPTSATIIKDTLDGDEFDITLVVNGEEGLSRYAEINPGIVVADIVMPKMNDPTMVKLIRETDTHIPVLFLSTCPAANDVAEDFETGGSDYLKRPFGTMKLVMRIKVLLHKMSAQRSEVTSLRIRLYTLNSITQTLVCQGGKQLLSNQESEILERLCDDKDQALPMKEILIDLWGNDSFFNVRSLHVFIAKLHHELSRDESIGILNIRGIGYKLIID